MKGKNYKIVSLYSFFPFQENFILDLKNKLLEIENKNDLSGLLIFANSADLDGCRKLIKRKEKNIIFFEIPDSNLKFNYEINLEDFLGLFCLAFLLGHLLKIQKEIFQQRKIQ